MKFALDSDDIETSQNQGRPMIHHCCVANVENEHIARVQALNSNFAWTFI